MCGKDKLLFYNLDISFFVNAFNFNSFLFSLYERMELCVICTSFFDEYE